jgi:PQQ-like domain
VAVGTSPSPSQTVTLENTTTAPLYVTLGTSGTASEYAVTDSSGNPVTGTPVELAPCIPYLLTVTFTPDAVSIFDSSFTFMPCEDTTTSACLAAQPISLSGQGVSGQLSLSPTPVVFTGVPEGSTGTQTVTVTNTGSAGATVNCIYLSSLGPASCGSSSSALLLGAPSVSLPADVPAGGSFTFPLTYQPTDGSTVTDTLEVAYIPQGLSTAFTATDSVQATPVADPCTLTITPSTLDFTYAGAGTPVTQSVTLTNTGGTSCQVTGVEIDPSSDVSYSLQSGQATSLNIQPGNSAPIGVTFELAINGLPTTRLGRLDFQSNDPSHASVQVPMIASTATPYAGGGAWPRWHHDNTQSGLSASDTSWLKGTIAWTFSVSVPPNNFYTGVPTDYMNSPVVGSDGTVYQLGMNGTIYAVTADGGLQWATPLEAPVADPHPGTPIVSSDGTLFVAYGDTEQVGLTNGLYHVSNTGAVLDAIPPANAGDGFDLPPMLTNGGLLLGADEAAGAFAFQIAGSNVDVAYTGSITADYDQISAVVGPDDSTYWCGGGLCYALSPPDAGFAVRSGWPINLGTTDAATSDLAFDELFTGNLMILIGAWEAELNSGSQMLYSINPQTAATNWTFTLPAASAAQQSVTYLGFAEATTGNSCPAIGSDGTVYVGNFDGLHAINGATGTEKSGFPFLTSSDVLTAPAIGGDGTIFIGTADGTFYAVNPNGTQRFKLSAGGRIAGSPAIGPSGAVYFTANDGNLYCVN